MRDLLNSFEKLEFDKVKKYIQRYSISDLGREHVGRLNPSTDLQEIRINLALVSEMKQLLESDDPLPLDNIFDIRTSLHRSTIENYILSADDLQKIGSILKTSMTTHVYFSRRSKTYPLLFTRVKSIHIENILEYNINKVIYEDGKIRDKASKELSDIRNQIVDKSRSLKKNLESILKSIAGKEWTQEEIITTREGRMVIPIKIEHKNHVPGFIHSVSSSGATVYIEPSITLELNNEIRTLHIQEQHEVEKILKELTRQVHVVKDNILANIQILSELDFIQSKAKYSVEVIGAEPKLKMDGAFILYNAFHPILIQKHGRRDVVPLNMEIPEDLKTVVITGPNAGGKSVAMKTVGLLTLLAQAGCHIPASPESELKIFTDIFVDMGDEQSIENDLSSFSSHLKNLKVILENANSASLILLDEIGSGTDPHEGASLAAAILECLTKIGSLNIATTHQGSLKAFAFETPYVCNAAMEFDQTTLQPTYHFRIGIPGSSYAFEMANRMNLPSDVIQRSREIIGDEANKLENLIIDLERHSQELKVSLENVNAEKAKLDSLNIVYKNKVTSLEKELKDIKLRAIDEAKHIVSKANTIIEQSVREIKESSAERQVIKKAKEEINQVSREFEQMLEEIHPAPGINEFQIGDTVRIKQSDTTGEIALKIDENYSIVIIGDVRMKVHRRDLEHVEQPKAVAIKSTGMSYTSTIEIKREIDLRGMYGDEAVAEVDKFIDQAIITGLHRIDIIHGKGTGALRKKITDYLKNNSSIKSFRLGEWNEGGTGVTVVELV